MSDAQLSVDTAPRGWHRPVSWPQLVVVALSVALIWLGLMATAWVYLRDHWQLALSVHDQPVMLRLPKGMAARADIHTPLRTRLDTQAHVAVPLDQMLRVALAQPVSAHALIKTTLPIDTVIRYEAEIPVVTEVDLLVPLTTWLPKMTVKVPVRFSVPVKMAVPVHLQVPLVLDVLATGQMTDALQVPLRTTMRVKFPVHADLQAEILSQAHFNLLGLQEPFALNLESIRLVMPLQDIGWCLRSICMPTLPN